MKNPEIPNDERERLRSLRDYAILDTLPEEEFEDITRIASVICKTPISLITLVDASRQWFKSNRGLNIRETPRELAFCAHAINYKDSIFTVKDSRKDERFHDNPLVTSDPNVVFYAGVPLLNSEGYALGTLCVIDHEPRELSEDEKTSLKALANQVTKLLELKRLNSVISTAEKQYREIVNDVNDMIYELDSTGRFKFVNKNVLNRLGYQEEEIIGKLYREVIHPEDIDRVTEFYGNQRKNKEALSYLELRLLAKNKGDLWIGQNVRMVFEGEWVTKVVAIARDITELREAQSKITEARQLLRAIIDNIPVNIYVKDAQSRKILANRAEFEHMGVASEQEIIGKDDFELYPIESAQISIDEDKKVLSGEIILNEETTNTLKDGTRKWFRTSKIPLRDDHDKIIGVVGISVDITESKKYEFALHEAREKAEEATLAKSRFLGTMSHEIRTPLNGIIGITNILSDNNPRPDQIENLKLLKFSCDNLLSIINDILDFNKIEAGKMELESISFNLREIAGQYVKMLGVKAGQKGIDLRLKLDERLPEYVIGDPVRLGQILNNLIGNAIKFTEKGFVEFSIKEISKKAKSHRIKITVKDSGIGIPADKIHDVFDGFSQASSDTTRKFGGTGLGLSITKRLVELMGSKVNVKSRVGEGSEFSFELTLDESDAIILTNSDKTPDATRLQPLDVLVVDDNHVNQIVASNYLAKLGHRATTASSGVEGVDLLSKKRFDLVLMDLQMPEKNGFQTAMDIRSKQEKYFKEVPIIALSADVLPEVKAKAFQSGMNDYLTKPFQILELAEILAKYAKRESTAKLSQLRMNIEEAAQGDANYSHELAKHILANLKELKSAFDETLNSQNREPFEKALHKSKTALFILKQDTLDAILETIKHPLHNNDFSEIRQLKDQFESILGGIITELSDKN